MSYQLVVAEDLSLNGRLFVSNNVGIGTNNPGATLQLTSATPQLLMFPSSTALGQTSAILFAGTFGSSSGTGDTGARYTSQIVSGFKPTAAWGGEYLAFNVGNGGAANDAKAFDIERMRIDGSGNVGIGTTNPQSALDVTGAIRVSGGITPTYSTPSFTSGQVGYSIVNYISATFANTNANQLSNISVTPGVWIFSASVAVNAGGGGQCAITPQTNNFNGGTTGFIAIAYLYSILEYK